MATQKKKENTENKSQAKDKEVKVDIIVPDKKIADKVSETTQTPSETVVADITAIQNDLDESKARLEETLSNPSADVEETLKAEIERGKELLKKLDSIPITSSWNGCGMC